MRIQVLHFWQDYLGNSVEAGVYDSNDEKLGGRGAYLVKNGHAVELDVPQNREGELKAMKVQALADLAIDMGLSVEPNAKKDAIIRDILAAERLAEEAAANAGDAPPQE